MCFNSLSFGRNISFCCTGLGYHSARQVGPGSMINRAEKRNRETASEEANYIMPEKHLRRSLVGWSLQGLIFSSFFSDILQKTYSKIQSFRILCVLLSTLSKTTTSTRFLNVGNLKLSDFIIPVPTKSFKPHLSTNSAEPSF